MRVSREAYRLTGVSLLALAAASTFQVSGAAACSATANGGGTPFQATSVTVNCTTTGDFQDVDGVFTTRFSGFENSSEVIVNDYDGNGDDVVRIFGGLLTDKAATTPGVGGLPAGGSTSLQPADGTIELLGGNDRFEMFYGDFLGVPYAPTVAANLNTGAGDDLVVIQAGSIQDIDLGDGADSAVIFGDGTQVGNVTGGRGDDLLSIGILTTEEGIFFSAPTVGVLSGGDGNDTIIIAGGTVDALDAGAGNDRVSVSGSAAVDLDLDGAAGNDTIMVAGNATIGGSIFGNDGDDTVNINGGTIGATSGGNITGGLGFDSVSVFGGDIKGGIDAEHVHLSGGTIEGDITGLGPNTLTIDHIGAVEPLILSDGVLFSGTGANGTVVDTDLAAGGKSQNFAGFDNFSADHSTLRFSGGTQGINQLNLGNGSTLFINGNVTMPGSIIATNSLINMMDGVADDVLMLGGLALNSATISLDINQQTLRSDQLVANAFSAAGTSTIIINLLGTPQFAQVTNIPIIVSASGPVAGTFRLGSISGTPGSLFSYEIVNGPNGGLFLRATPASFGIAAAPTSATNAGAVEVALDALYGINRDAIDADLHLSPASGPGMVPVSSSFGVFASGQFAHTEHDGYNISGGGLNGPGPSFDANDFSAAISLDFNAAKHFQFDNEYGLNIGVFAGYASTDVNLGAFQGFDAIGEGNNKAGLFGGYALLRKDYNYALVSASGFFGRSDVMNGVLDTTGSYDTEGYAVTGSVGHIFALGERTRFDLRGGLLGVSFRGDPYTDSGGNQFGKSRLSFGAIKFEPGIYGDYTLSNGMVFSPYARGELQQRFGYKNTTEIGTRTIAFDDADFSVALSTGFNLKVSELTTVNGEVRGKASSDSSTIGAKLGLKIAF
ncbi:MULTISPECIES: autotransporter [unclassified Mesorhizobium]|uniref:autotransporter n=1 Tax=unclassified Mesorhizobium TaxID=325217 RepID=UPI00112857EB|nr:MULTISPECIES: autotransporter [unclassified Mesorhizobium]TPI52070.1 autotransporter [Mesorhizobium sp. B3-1-1]TPJ64043.1 autotransporter [Mesorhizobium sp. B2-6-7]TPJ83481.1 autotransporter [Mesorhizobium sp. B2-6-3]TPJ97541.1 autotransporter [Mesorhizobium sp. B2-5-10]TPK07376.1 autotransporter [Mesorhizobium sp. B2-5-11]